MKKSTSASYRELLERMKEIYILGRVKAILGWDMRTYMPPKGIIQRSEQISTITKLQHDLFVSERIGDLLRTLESSENLDRIQKRNVELCRRYYDRETKIPTDLIKKLSKQESKTEHLWETAKKKSDFKMILNDLENLIELIKLKAEKINPDLHPYNVLLDEYEPKITFQQIDKYFEGLKKGIMRIQQKILDSNIKIDPNILKFKVSIAKQKEISKFIMNFLGLKDSFARIDETEHPFSSGYDNDIRITTHYIIDEPFNSFYSVLHEGGHALYDLNLPEEYLWQPIGHTAGLGVHESQSRFCENIIGKSEEFLQYALKKLGEIESKFHNLNFQDFYQAINNVNPTKIRIYSDEVTYNLHIILRYEIERDIFEDKISIAELPQVWNEKMEKYLYQQITNDKEGVLQDIHWYGGDFGYFPDYALGNIYDGVFIYLINKQIPNWRNSLKNGDATSVLNWLKDNIHKKGLLYDPIDLIKQLPDISKNDIDASYFVNYLEEKYKKIYKF
ncbi:MAG: carboxypeptidase M32 [Promethearchaeota archaeon]